MLSSGGITTVDTAARFPVRLTESGPPPAPWPRSSTASSPATRPGLVRHGRHHRQDVPDPRRTADRHRHLRDRARAPLQARQRPPVRIPTIELIEIGAGGGSIARVDELGLLKVGPDSAGAEPGPACYGQGGTHPTVTDADAVLGYLNPDFFLGGRMALDLEAPSAPSSARSPKPMGSTSPRPPTASTAW
jgi:N-methylhydantoinase A